MSQSNPNSLSPAPFWRPGVACRDGKLYHFGSRSAVVMCLWPEMRAWRRTPKTPWVHTRRHADEVMCRTPLRPGRIEELRDRRTGLVGPLSPDQYLNHHFRDSEAWARALATIPEQARCITSRFKERRWHLLAMLARCPGATDLLEANPALGFALASPWILHQPAVCQPMRSMRSLLRHKQTRIQDWLGLPATERVRRILKRIDPGALTGRLLPQLQRALWSDDVTAMLAHLPRISEEVLRWTIWPETRRRVTPSFLHELSNILPFDPEAARPSGTATMLCIARGVYAARGATEHGPLTPTLETPAPHLRLWTDGVSKSAWLGSSTPVQLRSIAQLRRWHATLENAVHKEYWRRASLELKEPWATPP